MLVRAVDLTMVKMEAFTQSIGSLQSTPKFQTALLQLSEGKALFSLCSISTFRKVLTPTWGYRYPGVYHQYQGGGFPRKSFLRFSSTAGTALLRGELSNTVLKNPVGVCPYSLCPGVCNDSATWQELLRNNAMKTEQMVLISARNETVLQW